MTARLLIVEDEPQLLQALAIRLSAEGFNCETAASGREALAKLADWVPDLIIADLLMPEMDGYTLVQQLKSDPRTAAVPIIVLTAIPDHVLARRAEELKGTCVMRKPFETAELLNTLRHMLATTTGGSAHGD
jgi:CheY-like chemotaxis protein